MYSSRQNFLRARSETIKGRSEEESQQESGKSVQFGLFAGPATWLPAHGPLSGAWPAPLSAQAKGNPSGKVPVVESVGAIYAEVAAGRPDKGVESGVEFSVPLHNKVGAPQESMKGRNVKSPRTAPPGSKS